MKQGLFQQQTIQRKINQTPIQSLHMLQFTSLELYEYINEISKENPLIEEVIYDFDIRPAKYKTEETVSFADINPSKKSVYDQLKEQLITSDLHNNLRKVVEYGINSLDEAGYLDISLEEWAENCGITTNITEIALAELQKLEPTGIGARSLGECLLLQLKEMAGYESYMEELLLEHLDWIADYKYETIIEKYSLTEIELSQLNKMIQSCNPKPGQLLSRSEHEYIFPEANVYKDKGSWKITFYNWAAPKIVYNKLYIEHADKATEHFLKAKKEQIEWIRKVIAYRTSTIELVIRGIVDKQLDFFENGLLHLVPMTLNDIANELKLHISTISRAITNKYIQTPHGVFPAKFFFQSGLKQGEREVAAIVLKSLIHDIIKNEDKINPLSDEKVKRKLSADYGLAIARRTVMKYRQQLRIESSVKRKKVT